MNSKWLPDIFYNWISAIGALLSLMSFNVIVLLLLIDTFILQSAPYLGILTFLVMPGFLVFGLILIAVGAFLARRQKSRLVPIFPSEIYINLNNVRHRNSVIIWITCTTILLLCTTVGTYTAYHATESVAFCGEVCHVVMQPEFDAYQVSPHARVSCAECHIGSGAEWFVKAKLSGLHQVYAVLTNSYQTPIPTPLENLRPARETCEQCHWPDKFFGGRKDVIPHFLADEANTPYPLTMILNIGGGGGEEGHAEGIHWHSSKTHHMEYAATDHDRMDIVWVRMTNDDGSVIEYTQGGEPVPEEAFSEYDVRSIDCMDCHNRPSHNYRSPIRAVNRALHLGSIDISLPYIKRESTIVLDQEYEDTPTALQAIEGHLKGFYQEEYPDIVESRSEAIQKSIEAVQEIFRDNIFPEMKVNWKAYPDHIGHSEFLGCFRCHGSELESSDGKTISKDCSLCHVILSQGVKSPGIMSAEGVTFRHPVDIDGAELEANCTECHEGGAELY